MISNSPKRKIENIYVVAADGFFTQDTVSEKFQISDAIYMDNQWNFFDSILPKRFGRLVFQQIEHLLGEMCSAISKEKFEEAYMEANMTLESMENRNHDKKVQLDTFAKY